MKLSELYSEYFANWISGGNLISKDRISLMGIKPLYDRFVTHESITKVWCITNIPVHYKNNLVQAIRTEMFTICPTVKTIVSMVNNPVEINPNSDIFTRQLKRTANTYLQYKDVFDNLREDEQLTGTVSYSNSGQRSYINSETLNRIKELYDSYTYVFEQSTQNVEFVESYIFIQASCKSRSEMRRYRKCLMKFLVGEHLGFVELKGNINQYLSNLCPASYEQEFVHKTSTVLLSQENLAAITNYKSKGLVGDQGVLMSIDWQTKLPFMWDFFHSGSAQVTMCNAKSGWGKTYMMFGLALGIMGYMDTHVSAIDIKGNEWSKLLDFKVKNSSIDGNIIDMDKGVFVNTLRLDDLNVSQEDCETFFKLAVQDTVEFYKLIINLQVTEGNVKDLEDILTSAVLKMYFKCNVVSNNRLTFKNTKNMQYTDLLPIIGSLESSASFTEDQKRLCKLIKTRCSSFFSEEFGDSSNLCNEITIQTILNSPLVIYSFNKNSNSRLSLLDSLRVFMVQVLDNRKAILRKKQGLFTAAFYEELQRCVHSSELIQYISSRVTGGRSDNLIIFLILNSISTFNVDDLRQIKSNITNYLIGRVNDDDLNMLINDFGCSDIADYLKLINSTTSEMYRNCFALKFDTGYKVDKAIIKSCVSDEMSSIMRTRDVVVDAI